jgi:putative transposase
VVWIPKYRKKAIFGQIRRELGPVLRELARQKESEILEGRMLIDHVHMLISIPPKYAVAQVVGYLKGKSAIHIARNYMGRQRNFTGEHFWARGYYASTVGIDEAVIRQYIQDQEQEDRRIDQLRLIE